MNVTTSPVEADARLIGPEPAPSVAEVLTPREREVVSRLSEGMTAVAIGHRLGVSPRTVEKHLENAYAKLGVCDRLGAVLLLYVPGFRPSP